MTAAWILATSGIQAQNFDELSGLFRYAPSVPLNAHESEMDSRPGYKLYTLQFDSPHSARRSAYLVMPDSPGRKPAIVWMHSSGAIAFLGDAVLMARAGAVSLLLESESRTDDSPERTRDSYIADVIALRRAADLLAARGDIDPARLAIVGHSYGAMMSAVAASIDSRFHAAVFEVGLLGMSIHIGTSPHPWAKGIRTTLGKDLPHYLEVLSVIDDKNYIGHAPAIPKLFQSARYDPGVPHKDAQDFFDAATGPKELKWYDTGHDVDDIAALMDRARFLGHALKLRNTERVLRQKAAPR